MTEVQEVKTNLAGLHSDVKSIKSILIGNGNPGLIRDVRTNSEHRISEETKSKLVQMAVGSGWLFTLITLGVLVFLK